MGLPWSVCACIQLPQQADAVVVYRHAKFHDPPATVLCRLSLGTPPAPENGPVVSIEPLGSVHARHRLNSKKLRSHLTFAPCFCPAPAAHIHYGLSNSIQPACISLAFPPLLVYLCGEARIQTIHLRAHAVLYSQRVAINAPLPQAGRACLLPCSSVAHW